MMMQSPSQWSSQWGRRFWLSIFLGGQVMVRLVRGRFYPQAVIEHMFTAGPLSLNPVLLTNFFSGMIFTIQMTRELMKYGAIDAVGGAFAIAFCRELAPILTSSIIAGQVGSAFAAELGSMRVTEQIDALQMLRTDPVDYLVVPRVVACCLMVPIMTVMGLVTGICGGLFITAFVYELDAIAFLNSVRALFNLPDLFTVLLKSFIFGAIVAILGCSWGLTTTGGVKGVGYSATAAVVTTWVSIFVVNFFLSLLMFRDIL
jgi:phospholipid/cholesterol/gamma-HCH transport system permease protein